MIDDRYYVKIVPQKGETVHRFEIHRRHIVGTVLVLCIAIFGSIGFAAVQTAHAQSQVSSLKTQTENQQATLKQIDRQTDVLRHELQSVQRQNQEIRQLIGAPSSTKSRLQKTSWVRGGTLPAVQARVAALAADSSATQHDSDSIRTLAMRVLNVRHIRDLARAQMIASIPSIDPVDGAEVVGCFCYRTSPDVGFHKGVDLGADYGMSVHAAAAGTIVAAGWDDGGYGNKIDIDHGNGYHTWYAHLSRVDVHVGDRVYKGQAIAAVGSTGFSTGPHLHYQVMLNGEPINPEPFLHGVPSNVLASLP